MLDGVPGIGRGPAGLIAGPPEAWLPLITDRGHMPRCRRLTTTNAYPRASGPAAARDHGYPRR